MRGGLIGSFILHVSVLLLILFGIPWLMRLPPPAEQVIPIDLVTLATKTASPPQQAEARVPQTPAQETAPDHPEAVPVPQAPPPQAAQHRAEEQSPPDALTTVTPERKPEIPKPLNTPKTAASPAARVQKQPAPADDLSLRLQRLAQLRQPTSPMPPNSSKQEGTGSSNASTTSANALSARDSAYGVKDFIRAQVERHWNLDGNLVQGNDWTVDIHIRLNIDGRVSQAEIVEDPRYSANSRYQTFARSARNAVLLSSPIAIPPEIYDVARDIVVDFRAKRVLH